MKVLEKMCIVFQSLEKLMGYGGGGDTVSAGLKLHLRVQKRNETC